MQAREVRTTGGGHAQGQLAVHAVVATARAEPLPVLALVVGVVAVRQGLQGRRGQSVSLATRAVHRQTQHYNICIYIYLERKYQSGSFPPHCSTS